MLPYSEIFSSFLGKITDFNLVQLNRTDLLALEIEWLHSAAAKPKVRNLFKLLSLDDNLEFISFKLNNPIDNSSDKDFVIDIFSLGMAIEWLQPKVDSVLNTAPMIGGKEEKKLLDNHKYSIERLKSMKTEQKKIIRDYGYINNSYINRR